MVAENNGSPIGLSGFVANSGNTDASGRITASITAAATANMPNWPSNFAVYAINPQTFYFMSIDLHYEQPNSRDGNAPESR